MSIAIAVVVRPKPPPAVASVSGWGWVSLAWLPPLLLLLLSVGATGAAVAEGGAPVAPVVLIPGVAGSVLYYSDVISRLPLGVAWLRFFDGSFPVVVGGGSLCVSPFSHSSLSPWASCACTDDYVVRKYMLVRYNETTMLTETLNPSVFLDVATGDHGLDGISLLDPDGARKPWVSCALCWPATNPPPHDAAARDPHPPTHVVHTGLESLR
jgi:hypothetical protein